jgi:aspartate ammonia-lyase
MPGKVNPVIPEVTNQVCFKVIGNDTAVCFAAEAGQLQLNVMEPIITECIFESITWLRNVMHILREKCIEGITVNREHNEQTVRNSIGIVTALNPYIGYKASTKIAKEALETGRGVYDLVLEHGLLSQEKLDQILDPKNMLAAH